VTTVAVDAMGGDRAPGSVLRGARAALADDRDLEVILVGDLEALHAAGLRGEEGAAGLRGEEDRRLRVHHAPDTVPMDAPAVAAARRSSRTSIAAGIALCEDGAADGFFSAGHTGAVAVAAGLKLARLPGVRRPAIAVTLPTVRGATLLLDAGANLSPRPGDLAAYAVLGTAYQRAVLGASAPKVGLLNIGSELGKGGARLTEASARLRATPGISYHGFVEGHDLFAGTTEVVVCDAFTGNAVLKVMEGLAETLLGRVRSALGASLEGAAARRQADAALEALARVCDYAEYGGAPLLGVDGVVWVGHGRSHEGAVRNGILAAARAARASVTRALRDACAAALVPAEAVAGGAAGVGDNARTAGREA